LWYLIASENIRENIKVSAKTSLGYYEWKTCKSWFDEGWSELLDQRKQATLQWLQHPSETKGDNLNNIRCEAGRNFTNKKRKYLKNKINELATNKNVREVFRGIKRNRDSVVSGYWLDDQRVEVKVPVGSRISSSPRRPDRLWVPPIFLSNGYPGPFLRV
jgi:hypothetical protein